MTRKKAAKKLGVSDNKLRGDLKKIRQLSDEELSKLAKKSNVSITDIRAALTHTASNPIEVTDQSIISTLMAKQNNRLVSSKSLEVHHGYLCQRIKKIRELPDSELSKYAKELNISTPKIKYLCRDMNPKKGTTLIDVLTALIKAEGRTAGKSGIKKETAKMLNLADMSLANHLRTIRFLPVEKLAEYAESLSKTFKRKITPEHILDLIASKQKSRIDFVKRKNMINALIKHGGSRSKAAEELKLNHSLVTRTAKETLHMTEQELTPYASDLGVSIRQIRDACADLMPGLKITYEQIIQVSSKSEPRSKISEITSELNISNQLFHHRINEMINMSNAELQKIARKTGVPIQRIREICGWFSKEKRTIISNTDIIRGLIASKNNRRIAAEKLGFSRTENINHRIGVIRRLSVEKLRQLAADTGISIEQINEMCVSISNSQSKGITNSQIIQALIKSKGSRSGTAKELAVEVPTVVDRIKSIGTLPFETLKKHADNFGVSINDLKRYLSPIKELDKAGRDLFKAK